MPLAVRVLLTLAAFVLMFLVITGILNRLNISRTAGLSLFYNNDGSLLLTWDAVDAADGYTVEVQKTNPEVPSPGDTAFSADVRENSVILPREVLDAPQITLRVNTYQNLQFFRGRLHRTGSRPLTATFVPDEPKTEHLDVSFDHEQDTMTVTWQARPGEGCSLYLMNADGNNRLFREVAPGDDMSAVIAFGEEAELAIPEREAPYAFCVRTTRQDGILTLYGNSSDVFYVTADDMKSRDISVSGEETEKNRFLLTWDETAGEGYEIWYKNARTGEEELVHTLSAEEERSFDTGTLPAGRTHTFVVRTTGGTPVAGETYAAAPDEIELTTDISVLYATVWPARQLPVYAHETGNETIDTVAQGQALCVLDETEDGYFMVRTGKGTGYIDATACLVNLPDIVGDLCAYDITNAYCCICRIQGYAIPGLTGEVVEGYEHILLADGTFVVPYLYPILPDLLSAIDRAADAGYRIKFYDSFRPLSGQMDMFNSTQAILDLPLPAEPYTPISADMYLSEGPKLPTEEELPPMPEEEELLPEGEEALPEEQEAAEDPALTAEEEIRPTYRQAITEGGWHIRWFLANGANQHNFGSAMDITLVDIETGEEALMQAPVHELSHLAVLDKNTEAANLMMELMTGLGYNNLRSEWWHFQDDNAHVTWQIPAIAGGLSIEGFKRDDFGWRYQNADGTFVQGESLRIDGRTYAFDAQGYTDY